MSEAESKRCLRCARLFSDRRRYKDFDAVHYCSDKCRKNRFSGTKREVARALLDLLVLRGFDKTLCPSEVARKVDPEDWRPLMPLVRATAWEFVSHGSVQVTQRGKPVDPDATGPIRLGLVKGR